MDLITKWNSDLLSVAFASIDQQKAMVQRIFEEMLENREKIDYTDKSTGMFLAHYFIFVGNLNMKMI
ncbi:MAG: hypothetical protein ACRDDZ_08720 [Marinifilaceae bacterium]